MCYRTQLNSKIKKIENTFDARFLEPELFQPREEINAFEYLKTPVVTNEVPGTLEMFHWGLIPFWAKDDKIRSMTLNGRIESLEEKPAFRNSVPNRCLVVATGYYEWQWLDPKGKTKQKYFIKPADQDLFAFAGIYSHWRSPSDGSPLNSYTIVTTEANELMSKIHNNKMRMPVVLRREDWNIWLSGADLKNFAFPYEVELKAEKV